MRMHPSRILCHAITLIFLSTVCSGCVKRMSAANEPALNQPSGIATLTSVKVSRDGSRIELTSDKPFTYTFYKAEAPSRVVVDISQTQPGPFSKPIVVNSRILKRVDLSRQSVGGGVLTRVEASLAKDVDFTVATDPSNKEKLLIALAQPKDQEKGGPAETREVPLAEARVEEKNLPPAAPPPVLPKADSAEAGAAARQEKLAKGGASEAPAAAPVSQVVKESAPLVISEGALPERKPRFLTAVSPTTDGIILTFEGGVETFNAFKLTKPDRIVIDIFGVKSKLPVSVVPIQAFGIANARIGLTPDKVRIVLDPVQETLPRYDLVKSDSGLKIRFTSQPPPPMAVTQVPVAPAVAPPEPEEPKVEVKPSAHVRGALESVDFKIVDGYSRVLLKLYGECQPGKLVHGSQGLSLSIKNCQVPRRLQRSLDTSGFGSPVLSVTPYQVRTKGVHVAKLMIRVKGDSPATMRQEGDLVIVDITNTGPVRAARLPVVASREKRAPAAPAMEEELVPPPKEEEPVTQLPSSTALAAKKVYRGRRVTLEFSDADVRKIFQLIAEVSNLNFLISDDVTGTISLKLVNVPWDQALDVILDAKGLAMQREGNIVQIKPRSKMQSQADEELAAKKALERSMELKTAVFEVNYASVSDVAAQFANIKSDRGTISKDERTSRVIVKDIQPAIDDMRELLKTLDSPEKQVMIEARIVEASSNFTRDLGVQWNMHYKDGTASIANVNSVDTGFGGVVSPVLPSATTGGIAMGMSFGKLSSNIQLDLRLSAAATIGQVKIISTPKVVTLNNKAAKISQGQSIPYQTTSAEGTKTEFVEAALTLEVTPHITADGAVSMKIKASNNSPGTGTPPPINKKEATTELLVANGETTVIGGIYVDSDTETDTGVPFLSDIPLLGWLFKSNTKSKLKTELLIFITPKIVT